MDNNARIDKPFETKFYIIQAIGTRKDGIYLLSHHLFKIPVPSL